MPLKTFQRNYWALSDTVVQPVKVSRSGYPGWQITVIASLWGAVGDYLAAAGAKGRWIWGTIRRLWALSGDDQRVVMRVLDVLDHPAYPNAQAAVKVTAYTRGFHDPEAWKPYSHMLKGDRGRAENVFRHMKACELTRQTASSTLTNPTVNLMTELAYQDYAMKGR